MHTSFGLCRHDSVEVSMHAALLYSWTYYNEPKATPAFPAASGHRLVCRSKVKRTSDLSKVKPWGSILGRPTTSVRPYCACKLLQLETLLLRDPSHAGSLTLASLCSTLPCS